MVTYTLRRLALTVPTVLGVVVVVWLLIHLMPGDPVEVMLGETAARADRDTLRAQLGLNRPLAEQFSTYITGLASGDLGTSIHSRRPVAAVVAERLPATIMLTLAALAVAIAIALPAGIISAVRRGGATDRIALTASLAGVAIPNFWLGPMLIILFSLRLGWLPVAGSGTPAHLVLPALTLGIGAAGILTRMTRAAVLETLGEDYIRTARAKGLGELRVIPRHALRNALSPILTLLGLQVGSLLAGSVITETIFAWPGIGRLIVDGIYTRDYPVVQGCVLVIAIGTVLVNLATDLTYAWVNPRVRYGDAGN